MEWRRGAELCPGSFSVILGTFAYPALGKHTGERLTFPFLAVENPTTRTNLRPSTWGHDVIAFSQPFLYFCNQPLASDLKQMSPDTAKVSLVQWHPQFLSILCPLMGMLSRHEFRNANTQCTAAKRMLNIFRCPGFLHIENLSWDINDLIRF